jgi:hypothetical protein
MPIPMAHNILISVIFKSQHIVLELENRAACNAVRRCAVLFTTNLFLPQGIDNALQPLRITVWFKGGGGRAMFLVVLTFQVLYFM